MLAFQKVVNGFGSLATRGAVIVLRHALGVVTVQEWEPVMDELDYGAPVGGFKPFDGMSEEVPMDIFCWLSNSTEFAG